MKTRIISLFASAALVAGLVVPPSVFAADSSDVTKALSGSSSLELPAKAASLVSKASAADKKDVAVSVVKAAIGLKPAAAVAVVSAVVRDNPSTAPAVAVAAVTLQHKQIGLVVKAAVTAAPSEAGRIVAALIKEFPKDYSVIAIAAAEGAPSAGREILTIVANSVPALQPSIQEAISMFAANDGNIPVLAILSQSNSQAPVASVAPAALAAPLATSAATPLLAGPVLGPPFTTVTTIINYTPSQTTPQQPGGRLPYASP